MIKCAVCGLVLSVALAPAYALTGRECPVIVLLILDGCHGNISQSNLLL